MSLHLVSYILQLRNLFGLVLFHGFYMFCLCRASPFVPALSSCCWMAHLCSLLLSEQLQTIDPSSLHRTAHFTPWVLPFGLC